MIIYFGIKDGGPGTYWRLAERFSTRQTYQTDMCRHIKKWLLPPHKGRSHHLLRRARLLEIKHDLEWDVLYEHGKFPFNMERHEVHEALENVENLLKAPNLSYKVLL